MPELPEVETVARDLRGLITGATIVGARTYWPRTLRDLTPQEFARQVAGRRIEGIGRRAKEIRLDLSEGAALTIHLKMTGQLFVVPATQPEDAYLRLVLELADGREIRFRDIRKFGRVGLYPGEPERFAALGPEPLDDAFTVGVFRDRLRRRRGRLKPLLLDQTFVAGVGNIYADEALWSARLHPLRSASTLRPADARRLHTELRRILAEAIVRRGSSIDDYTAPEGDGSMQERLLVYQRAGEPCPRCGRPIRRIIVGGRATHFCSWCQRLPRADRLAARTILQTMATPKRVGGRWTELDGGTSGGGPVGLTRAERTRKAAATRRAAARASAGR
jgi:formamidopyrimidine-DNA glycosylase